MLSISAQSSDMFKRVSNFFFVSNLGVFLAFEVRFLEDLAKWMNPSSSVMLVLPLIEIGFWGGRRVEDRRRYEASWIGKFIPHTLNWLQSFILSHRLRSSKLAEHLTEGADKKRRFIIFTKITRLCIFNKIHFDMCFNRAHPSSVR